MVSGCGLSSTLRQADKRLFGRADVRSGSRRCDVASHSTRRPSRRWAMVRQCAAASFDASRGGGDGGSRGPGRHDSRGRSVLRGAGDSPPDIARPRTRRRTRRYEGRADSPPQRSGPGAHSRHAQIASSPWRAGDQWRNSPRSVGASSRAIRGPSGSRQLPATACSFRESRRAAATSAGASDRAVLGISTGNRSLVPPLLANAFLADRLGNQQLEDIGTITGYASFRSVVRHHQLASPELHLPGYCGTDW